jgi:preprotein translocase subunit SecG
MYWALIVLHVIVCTFLVLVVLLQAGKGGGMGIAFGGGGSQTVFGSSGAGNFLTKLTAICATIFFLNSLGLAYLSSQSDSNRLRSLGDKKASAKQQEEAAKKKVLDEVAKQREALQKSAPASGAAPASGTAPASGAPAPSGSTTTAPAGGSAPVPSAPAAPPAAPKAPAPAAPPSP